MLGLALQGGGAKGAFQAGAIKALFEEGYVFDGVVGSSIGALNGALIAQGEFDKTYDLWYNMEISQLFDIDDTIIEDIANLNISSDTIKYVFRKIKETVRTKGIDRAKGRELINKYLNEDKLRASNIDFGMMTIEKLEKITQFKPLMLFKEDIPKGQLVDYIIASGNLPIFSDIMVGEKKLYDGGLYDNLPINMLIDKGYKDIIAIRLGESLAPVKSVKDKSVKITYIDPSEKPGSMLNFTNKSVRRAMILGYFDTLRTIRGLEGKKYYVYPIENKEIYKALYRLSPQFYMQCSEILEVPFPKDAEGAVKTLLIELKKLMKLDEDISDSKCMINFLEIFSDYSRVERFKIYKFIELLDKTIRSYNKIIDFSNKKFNKRLDKLKRIFDIYIKYVSYT